MDGIRDAILAGSSDDLARLPVPDSYRGVLVRADEQHMFDGLPAKEKDPRKSLHVEEVATPELGPGEAIVAVMAEPGDEVVAHCLSVELEDPMGHDDTMMDLQQRIWGFETNFGGLAELALVKSNQLMPELGHLSWRRRPRPGWSTPPPTGSWSATTARR